MAVHMPSPSSFSSLGGSSSVHPGTQADYGAAWKDIKPELDCNGFQVDNYNQNAYQGSPQGLSSCMFSSHSVSPSMLHPLPFGDQPTPHPFMGGGGAKENGYFRDVPQCRRRLDFNHNSFMDLSKPVPVAVAKRNERERNRVKLINMTFQTLRQHLPVPSRGSKGKTRKLSKVQTLRSAIDYIRKLEHLINCKKHNNKEHFQTCGEKTSNDSDDPEGLAPLKVPDVTDSCNVYGSLYEHQVSSSPGEGHHGSVFGTGSEHSISSPENHYSAASTANSMDEEASPLPSETSLYEVVAADEDEFLDFDFWF